MMVNALQSIAPLRDLGKPHLGRSLYLPAGRCHTNLFCDSFFRRNDQTENLLSRSPGRTIVFEVSLFCDTSASGDKVRAMTRGFGGARGGLVVWTSACSYLPS